MARLERKGLKVIGLRLLWVSRELAERHYAVHAGKHFYAGLVEFITSGPVAAVAVEELRAQFPSIAKIGPVQKMRQIVDSALPGVPLRHTPTPPPQLRVLPGFVYFELDRGVPDWREFATAPALGLHVAGEWPQLKMELWCVKRSGR